jgi:hypothetical protein
MTSRTQLGHIARPDLPKPGCRVVLVCGPPAAGKSSYVEAHASPGDLIIDLDLLARERGYGRERPADVTGELLRERNARLAALATVPPDRTAWVIIGAPSASLRAWWCETLGVQPDDLIVLAPPREELRRRIMNDPDRSDVRQHHLELADCWLQRERDDNPGIVKHGYDASGYPTDPLHPWNKSAKKL